MSLQCSLFSFVFRNQSIVVLDLSIFYLIGLIVLFIHSRYNSVFQCKYEQSLTSKIIILSEFGMVLPWTIGFHLVG